MANKEIWQFPLNATPESVDLFAISNEFEPGHVTESTSIENVLSAISRLGDLAAPLATDYVTVVPVVEGATGEAFRFDMQSLADFLETLSPTPTPTQQEVYNASGVLGTVALATGKPGGWTGTTAGVFDPSMSEAQFQAIAAPTSGLHGYANDLDRPIYWDGSVYQTVAWESDIAAITTDGAVGETYFTSNATATVIAAPATPVQIAGTFIAGSNNSNFTASAAGALTYNGTEAVVLDVELSLSAYFDAGYTGLINVYVYKDGLSQPNLIGQYSIDGVSSTPKPLIVTGKILVNPTNVLTAWIENVDSDEDIIAKSINLSCSTIGGAGDAGSLTWNQTIVNGDGTATATAGKFISVVSSDSGIPPLFGFDYTVAPGASQSIGELRYLANGQQYALIQAKADAATPLANSVNAFYGYSSSSPYEYLRYVGLSNTISMFSDVALANKDLSGIKELIQFGANATYNQSQLDGIIHVNTISTVDAYTLTCGPNPADEKANYKIPLTVLGTQDAGVNGTLGTVSEPNETFPASVYTDVIDTLSGTNVISSGSFNIGQTIEINIVGSVTKNFPLANSDAGSTFRFTFDGLPPFVSESIPSTGYSTGSGYPWSLSIKMTRLSSGDVTISGNGYSYDSLGNYIPIIFIISAGAFAYNDAAPAALTLEFRNGNSAGNDFSFVARNMNIIQYT